MMMMMIEIIIIMGIVHFVVAVDIYYIYIAVDVRQTKAIIFLSRFESYQVASLKSCESRSRIFTGIASSIFCCENVVRKLQLNGRNRDLCIPLLLYFRK